MVVWHLFNLLQLLNICWINFCILYAFICFIYVCCFLNKSYLYVGFLIIVSFWNKYFSEIEWNIYQKHIQLILTFIWFILFCIYNCILHKFQWIYFVCKISFIDLPYLYLYQIEIFIFFGLGFSMLLLTWTEME